MKIENFEKAKEIREKIDALQEQLEQVQSAIKDKKELIDKVISSAKSKFEGV